MVKNYLKLAIFSSLLFLVGGLVFSQDGLSKISNLVPLDEIDERGTVSRYDLAHFLNMLDCTDCLNPEKQVREKYSPQRRETIKSEADTFVDDVVPGEERYGGNEYSVCVASVIDKGWMSGYPKTTSPFCPGRFCGSNTLSFGEFVQTMVSYMGDDAYALARIDRNKFIVRIENEGVILDNSSIQIVNKQLEACGENSCDIGSTDEFGLYIRYCRHNLAECGMQTTNDLKNGDYGIAYANILMDLGMIQAEEIQDLGRFAPMPSDIFLEVFDELIETSGCTWSNDADLDGVENQYDNCVNDYNPLQSDQDGDGVGNVCDFDIDGDGVINTPGVIDDQGNIRYELVGDSKDNCVIIPNADQGDRDRDQIGNVCDSDEKSLAGSNAKDYLPEERLTSGSLLIKASVLQGSLPLVVDFEPYSDRVIEEVERYFGDGSWSSKNEPEHIFDESGIWTVRAVATFDDGSKAVAKQSINVVGDSNSYIAFQGYADILEGVAPLDVSLQHIYQGELDSVIWTIGDDQVTVQAGQEYSMIFDTPGLYEVLAQGLKLDKVVATSRFSLDVMEGQEDGRGGYLEANPLVVVQGDLVEINTQIAGFDPDQISLVTRQIGDQSFVNKELLTSQRFVEQGPIVVRQRIDFLDGYPSLSQEMTIYVSPGEQVQNEIFGATLAVSKELLQVGEEVEATIEIVGGEEASISSIQRKAGPSKRDNTSLQEDFVFDTSGAKRIVANIITTASELIILETTINVLGNEQCVSNNGFCDLDDDNIIDMCDIDIDGDGVENMLGLLIGENDECRFTAAVVDIPRLEEQISRIRKGDELDNCPFRSNSDQEDVDGDALGDECDDSDEPREEPTDSDGDGIDDEEDACPDIPENKNGQEDEDGCPEIGPGGGASAGGASAGSASAGNGSGSTDGSFNDDGGNSGGEGEPFVKVDQCIQCPCAKADYASELMVGDRVKAVLVDPSESIVYSQSGPRAIRVNE